MLIVGDFSGRSAAGGGETPLAARKILRVDRDNFDGVVARLKPRAATGVVGPNGQPVTLEFGALDDFHPDALFRRVELFADLRSLRRRLAKPETFSAAAEEARAWLAPPTPAPPPQTSAGDEPPSAYSTEGLFDFDTMLEETAQQQPAGTTSEHDWNAMIREIGAAHSLPDMRDKGALEAALDVATSDWMRRLLHDRAFQRVEAAWRSLFWLVRKLETDSGLQLHLLDATDAEVAADLAGEDLAKSVLYKRLVEETIHTPGGVPWALVVGLTTFSATADDAQRLGRIAKIAHAAGAPFVARGHERLAGCSSLVKTPDPDHWSFKPDDEAREAWAALRALPEAASAALACPRVLLRLPYGRRLNPAESFSFEELPDGPVHDRLLWGNPAVACALLWGQAFSEQGWGFKSDDVADLEDLPLYVYDDDGESMCYPCAEAILVDRAVEQLVGAGLIALVGFRGTDSVRMGGAASIAGPRRQITFGGNS